MLTSNYKHLEMRLQTMVFFGRNFDVEQSALCMIVCRKQCKHTFLRIRYADAKSY